MGCVSTNMTEKNSQVRLMSRISSQAMSTVVWLGLPPSSSNAAIGKILEFFFLEAIVLLLLPSTAMRIKLVDLNCSQSSIAHPPRFSAPAHFSKGTRTIHDLALNKNTPMFTCGNTRFSRPALQGDVHVRSNNLMRKGSHVPFARIPSSMTGAFGIAMTSSGAYSTTWAP